MAGAAAWVEGVGVIGPGLNDWPGAAAVLAGEAPWQAHTTVLPALTVLPPAERRRAGLTVRLALAAGLQAVQAAGAEAATLSTVFTSSGGDGQNCHEICLALASAERQISPTRFHNSVHNAASGYWGIATAATPASNALCAYDGSFAAGLLEALVQVAATSLPVLLVAHDVPYPSPLHEARPIPAAFAAALVLAPGRSPASLARITAAVSAEAAGRMPGPLEALRAAVPAARALPLLAGLAARAPARVVLDYLDDLNLAVEIAPCR